jgi:hypothetical protein
MTNGTDVNHRDSFKDNFTQTIHFITRSLSPVSYVITVQFILGLVQAIRATSSFYPDDNLSRLSVPLYDPTHKTFVRVRYSEDRCRSRQHKTHSLTKHLERTELSLAIVF